MDPSKFSTSCFSPSKHLIPRCILVEGLKSLRNGFLLGVKIRIIGSFAVFINSNGDFKSKLIFIMKGCFSHGKTLGLFAFFSRLLHYLYFWIYGRHLSPYAAGVIGLVVGFCIFRTQDIITKQITLYLLGRMIFAILRKFTRFGVGTYKAKLLFPIIAGLCWGMAMYFYVAEPQILSDGIRDGIDVFFQN